MRAFGILLIILAGIALMGALGMDTTVSTSTGTRINNFGLMHYQQMGMLVAVGLFIGGVIFIAAGGRGDANAGHESFQLTGSPRKCHFCAETIKREAIVCRYCGRDLPVTAEPAPDVTGGLPHKMSVEDRLKQFAGDGPSGEKE